MTLHLEFLGAKDSVTGSRTMVHYSGQKWLVDCGLFQGDKAQRQRNWQSCADWAKHVNAVILTHAHLDHSGYLPRFCRDGFQGSVFATGGTADLTRLLLLDAAHLEEENAWFANSTHYSHHVPALPLFTTSDAETAAARIVRCRRDAWTPLVSGLQFRFLRAGHIIGSSLVQLSADLGDKGNRVITFSGDLGNGRSLHLRPPEVIRYTDVLVLESTYGDRLQPRTDALEALAQIINRTASRGGVLVIPAFAVGRAQELTYMVRLLQDAKRIPDLPVILDSPMAAEAMGVCLRHRDDQVFGSAFSGEADPLRPKMFEVTQSSDESTFACMREGPLIVISASGMLSGGRILHHLRARLPKAKNTVLFCGFQADGTKGRYLQEHSGDGGSLRIFHQEVPIEAEIVTLDHLSAHADQADILDWLAKMDQLPRAILLNHGEVGAQRALADAIEQRFGLRPSLATESPLRAVV